LRDVLAAEPRLEVELDDEPARWLARDHAGTAALVLNYVNWMKPDPDRALLERLQAAVSNGMGLVLVHFACGAFQGRPAFVEIAGRVWNPRLRGHDPRGVFRVRIVDPDQPVTRGMADFDTDDELYTCRDGPTPIRVLASAVSRVDGRPHPMLFVLGHGRGRIVHCTLGHDLKAIATPSVLELCRRGTVGAAGLDS